MTSSGEGVAVGAGAGAAAGAGAGAAAGSCANVSGARAARPRPSMVHVVFFMIKIICAAYLTFKVQPLFLIIAFMTES